jgi:hypothetical protein
MSITKTHHHIYKYATQKKEQIVKKKKKGGGGVCSQRIGSFNKNRDKFSETITKQSVMVWGPWIFLFKSKNLYFESTHQTLYGTYDLFSIKFVGFVLFFSFS